MTQPDAGLERFLRAQEGTFGAAIGELRAGRKRTHWMWFVFPQMRGLGRSPTAEFFGISSIEEARAYLAHPTLGPRLVEAAEAAMSGAGERSLREIFGSPDDLKFRSSMTLFAKASTAADSVFSKALARFCDGLQDEATLAILARGKSGGSESVSTEA